MPINSVASWTRLTSHKPQQKCIHCNSVPTDKFLTFDKTKYRENNTIVNQMTENDEQNIICNKSHNVISRESLVTCLTCDKTMKKCLHWNLIWTNTSYFENKILVNAEIKQNKLLHMQELPLTTPTKMYIYAHLCCNTDVHKDICKMYNKVRLWLHTVLLYHDMLTTCITFCKCRPIYMCIMW